MLKTVQQKPFVKGFKFPIYPTESQRQLFEQTFGCCRYVYNKGIEDAKAEYEHYLSVKDKQPVGDLKKPSLTGFSFANRLPSYKANPDSTWLADVSYDVLQQTMFQLGEAFSRFFKERKGYPKFKKRHSAQSFRLTKNVFRFKDKELYIAKSKEPLAVGYSRELPSEPSSCTISRTPTGRYYISFVCEYFPERTNGQGKIGIDLGIKDFAVMSNGEHIANNRHFATNAKNLRRKQQNLSRCKKGSKRYQKARLAVAKIHEAISNARNSKLHQLSRRLVNENQVIGIEGLRVYNMLKNRRLAKHIADVSWSKFKTMLIYKARESQNCNIVSIDTFYPSTHICNDTKEKLDRKLKLSERTWLCPYCGKTHDRDLNASLNIRDEAIRILTTGKLPNTGLFVLGNQL